MLEELSKLEESNSLEFKENVEDVALYGKKNQKGFDEKDKKCIRTNGLNTKDKKERFYTS
ncbi:hypothetical protein [Salmonella enterica]|uniref:hypothetical protein n=1 Tax=Salmonella enterica TaxID=28901 RepID=UPI0032119635